MAKATPHLLIIESPYYEKIAESLRDGAVRALEEAGATYDVIAVPGVLEIPCALAMALEGMDAGKVDYDAAVTLGCVIRGETTHYDIVAGESARAIMDITVESGFPVGNGILTVENESQAWARAKRDELDKGGFAAKAALQMIDVAKKFM